jgi:hypothetical protein
LPFGGWRDGNGLDARSVAKLLKPYGVKPGTLRVGEVTMKGYRAADLLDPWARYLPLQEPSQASHPSHAAEPSHENVRNHWDVTAVTDVTAVAGVEEPVTDSSAVATEKPRTHVELAERVRAINALPADQQDAAYAQLERNHLVGSAAA